MKKLISLLALTALFASCMGAEDADETVEDTTDEVSVETTINFSSLAFTMPSEWTLDKYPYEEDGGEIATFIVPDDKYEVTLFMEINETDAPADMEDIEKTDLGNGLSYNILPCAPALGCYELTAENYYTTVSFYIESTEEAPEDLDGVWMPGTEITTEDLVAFLETAELTAK